MGLLKKPGLWEVLVKFYFSIYVFGILGQTSLSIFLKCKVGLDEPESPPALNPLLSIAQIYLCLRTLFFCTSCRW